MEKKNETNEQEFRVIACDDEQGILDTLKVICKRKKFEFYGTTDVEDLVREIKANTYDLLILDYFLIGTTAEKVLPIIREFSNIYTILLTGHAKDLAPLNIINDLSIQNYCEKEKEPFPELTKQIEDAIKRKKDLQVEFLEIIIPKILTPNEQIKNLRMILNLNQNELAQGVCSANTISLIENDRLTLSAELEEGLRVNFNKLINNKKLKHGFISQEYFSIDTQIATILEKYKKEFEILESSNNQKEKILRKITELEMFLKENEKSIKYKYKFEIYEIISSFYYKNRKLSEGYTCNFQYLRLAIEHQVYDNLISAGLNLIRFNLIEKNFQGIASIGEIIKTIIKKEPIKNQNYKRMSFNVAIAYQSLKRYTDCLELLSNIKEDYSLSVEEGIDIDEIKANCYFRLGTTESLKTSKEIHLSALKLALDIKDEFRSVLIYNNLVEVLLELNEKDLGLEYLKDMNKIKIDDAEAMFNNVKWNIKYDNCEYVYENYIETLNLLSQIDDKFMHVEYCDIVVDYFILKNDSVKLMVFLDMVKMVVLKNNNFGNMSISSSFFKAMHLFAAYRKEYMYQIGMDVIRDIEKNNRLLGKS